MRDRGQTLEEVSDRYLDTVRYRHDELVEPSRWYADIVLNGANQTGLGAEAVAALVRSKLN